MYVKGLFEVFKILGRIGIKPKDVIGMGGDIVKMGKSLFNTRVNPKLLEFIAKNQKIPTKILENIKIHARTLKNATENQKNLFLENIKSIQKAKMPIKPPSPVTGVQRPATSVREQGLEAFKGWKPTVIKGGKDGLATGGIANHFRERVGFADGPPGTIKKATGPTKKNTGSTSPVKTDTHIYKRTNKHGTVWSDTKSKTSEGWLTRKTASDDVVRERLLKKGKTVQQHNGKFIFADVAEQAAFDDALRKRYSSAKTSTGGKKVGVLSNAEIYERFLKGYSKDGIHDLIFRHKKANDLEYVKLSAEEKAAHKVERDKLIKKYQNMRASGTRGHPAHHLYSLSDEFDVRSKDIVIIPKEVNERLGDINKKIKVLAEKRKALLSKIDFNNVKHIPDELKAIDKDVQNLIDNHYKKFPQDKGLLKWRKINSSIGTDGLISFSEGSSIGGDSKKWIHKDMGKNINKLDANERRVFKAYLLNKAKKADLKKIDGVGTFFHSFPANLGQSNVVKSITGVLGKVLKPVAALAGAAAPLDMIPIMQARNLGIKDSGKVGLKNLAEDYGNIPGLVWEAGEWVASKAKGKEHEWKTPYELDFGKRATVKSLREISSDDLVKNIKNRWRDIGPNKLGIRSEDLGLEQENEEALNQRIENALNKQKWAKSLPEDHELVKETVEVKEEFLNRGGLSGVDQYILDRYK